MYFIPFYDVNPVAADTIGMYFIGVYFSKMGATSQLSYIYLIIAHFLPATILFT